MPQIVEVPGQGNVEFPDSMSDQDIGRVIRLHVPEPETKGSPEWAQWRNQRVHDLNDAATSDHKPEDQGFFHGLWQNINPFPAIKELAVGTNPETGKAGGPLQGLQNMAAAATTAAVEQGHKAVQAAKGEGEFQGMTPVERASSAVGHGVAAVLPVIGPAAANAGEAIGGGQPAEGVGQAVGLLGAVVAPEAAGAAADAVRGSRIKIPLAPALRNPNPAVADAVDFGLKRGIPVDAGTATGNFAIKAGQHLADRSIGGALANTGAPQAAADALEATGRDLAASVHPTAVTPESAGAGVQKAVESSSNASAAKASAAYEKLQTIENDPANLKDVQVGMKQNPSLDPTQPDMIPDIQKVASPVDMRPVKNALRPLVQQLSERMTPAERAANPSLTAMENIISRADALPASAADKDLSYLRGITRSGSSSDQVKYFAGRAIDALDKQVQDAVTQAGPDAIKALHEGRAATIDKYAARDVLDSLRDEPVQAFNQSLWKNDAGIEQLRAVQKFAPGEMPKLGRAFVDDLVNKATAEGDFSKQNSIWSQWQSLGPETKKIIFNDPKLVNDLDNFFLLAKKMGENPNPSGTAHVVSIGSQSLALALQPHIAIPIELSGAVLSKMLHNHTVVRALTEGMQVPIGSAAAPFVAGKILAHANRIGLGEPQATPPATPQPEPQEPEQPVADAAPAPSAPPGPLPATPQSAQGAGNALHVKKLVNAAQ